MLYELLEDDQKKKLSKNNEVIAKVTTIKEEKDLATLPLDKLVENVKVYEMILENDGVISKTIKKVKSLALKAKVNREQISDDSDSQGRSDEVIEEEEEEDEAFNLMARNFYKFFRKALGTKMVKAQSKTKLATSECSKPMENKAFIGGAWCDSEDRDEHHNDTTCLMEIDCQEIVDPITVASCWWMCALGFRKLAFVCIAVDTSRNTRVRRKDTIGITTPCEICSSPHVTQYCMEDPEQACVKYASSRTDKARENKKEEKDNPENIHVNPSVPPDPSISFITKKVLKLNSFFESLGLVPQSSNTKLVFSKGDDGDVMFIEIVKTNNDSHKEKPKVGEQEVEYFDIFLTKSELSYHKENSNRGVRNFIGRIKGMHVFIGNFTFIIDFMIFKDISSIIDPRLSQVVLGRPFVEISNMTHDPPKGVVRFTNKTDEITYKMSHTIEQYNSLSDLEKEHTKSVYLRNEEDKRRGVEYVMNKIQGFYKECLELGFEYATGMDNEGEVTGEGDGGAWRGAMVAVVSWDEGDEGGDEMMWRWSGDDGAAVVDGGGGVAAVGVDEWGVATRGEEWCRVSIRSCGGESFWVRRKRSPKKFSGGDGQRWWLTGGGGRRLGKKQYLQNKVQQIRGARERDYAIDGGIWYSVVSSKMNQLHSFTYAPVG
uniref:Retrotransposon Orf1 n=1 Tax=Tanacetum cinerariifolium TaxID=118510 RepID=A0A6L2NDB6_TANCI|nr:retrotransposon Orf1 [Tanacetum cinerariifolium]